MSKSFYKKSSGGTIIEAVLAMGIILVVISVFLMRTMTVSTMQKQSFWREQALFLAQENIEVVRNMRDSNWLHGCPSLTDTQNCFFWNSGFSQGENYRFIFSFLDNDQIVVLQSLTDDFSVCVQSESCRVYLDSTGKFVNEATAQPTNFYRAMELRQICENKTACGGDGICASGESCSGKVIGVEIYSFVKWWERDSWRNVEITERIYDWR
ncbi:MAG: hypothetical protein WCT18_00515 [Patescibacteria group bacterium]